VDPAFEVGASPKLIYPGMAGAHNWQPMSFSPATGLVYIPAIEVPMVFIDITNRPAREIPGTFSLMAIPPEGYQPEALANLLGPLPPLEELTRGIAAPVASRGVLRAFDPVTGRIVWEQPGGNPWDGGALSTAGC